ncbi:GNAT family N-acetyltransferase [Micromonospora cathayae]|uniref:GNAT family N-acetyltransferase n=1 Tax=Micromonospora cathayae TaxID=3028804 RepID=A0ABY7ZN68_9ACTN|nr:GNAT family N-acetyltransferase [Micromonospora sp. HUAS 3]WDZ83876.1 GNAT family N-acetyltransferase [Micromonospora sp. HUAS 3]
MSAPVEFRPATAADVPSLHALWDEAFTDAHVTELHGRDPGSLPRTLLAVQAATVVAAVHYLPRRIRNAAGGIDLVGGVANVASRAESRGRGHVRRLLELAGAVMAADGCAWSLLFTGTPGVYLSSGYRPFTLRYPSGRPAAVPAPVPSGWTVHAPAAVDWAELAGMHAAFNAHRPLSTVRDAADWELRVPVWYAPPTRTLVARFRGQPAGYLVSRWTPGHVQVVEVAVRPDRPDALSVLFGAVARAAADHHVRRCTARLPADPAVVAALPALLTEPVTETDDTGMVRPVHATPGHVRAIVEAPGAFHWPADYL